jgi:hypothetical protein
MKNDLGFCEGNIFRLHRGMLKGFASNEQSPIIGISHLNPAGLTKIMFHK